MLGIVKKHHEMLEQACHDIDNDIALVLATETAIQYEETASEDFINHVSILKESYQIGNKLDQKQRELDIIKNKPMDRETRAKRHELNKTVKNLSEKQASQASHELKL